MRIDKIANFINHSPKTQKVLRSCSDNPALYFACASFAVQTTIRPMATLATSPNSDGIYGACSSISSAITEMIGSYAIFKPMNNSINNASKQLYDTKGIFYKNPNLLRSFKSVTNRIAKQPATLLISMARFSLVGPIAVLLSKIGIQKNNNKKLDIKK